MIQAGRSSCVKYFIQVWYHVYEIYACFTSRETMVLPCQAMRVDDQMQSAALDVHHVTHK